MALADLITIGTATLHNFADGTWVRGVYVPADPEDNPEDERHESSCQPDRAANFTAFNASGNRGVYHVNLYIDPSATIRPESHVGPEQATTFTHTAHPGRTFRVLSVDDWTSDVIGHKRAKAVSVDETPRTPA